MLHQYPTRSHPPPQPAGPPAVTVRELHHAALIQGGIFLRGSGPIVPGQAPIEEQQQQQQQGTRQQQLEQQQRTQTVVVSNAKRRWVCWRLLVYILAAMCAATALGLTEGYFAYFTTTFITACLGFTAALGLFLCFITLCNIPLVELIMSSVAFILGSIAAGLLVKRLGHYYAWLYEFYAGSLAAAWLCVVMWAVAIVLAIARLRSSPGTRRHEFDNPNVV